MKNYFSVLGLRADCSDDDIVKAYKILSVLYHPSKIGRTDKYRMVKTSYEFLSDTGKRRKLENELIENLIMRSKGTVSEALPMIAERLEMISDNVKDLGNNTPVAEEKLPKNVIPFRRNKGKHEGFFRKYVPSFFF